MSELVALNWKQDADFQTLVMVTEKALEKIATERFGVHPMEKLWSVLGPTIRSEISKWKSDPKISRTEILISLFDGDTTRILNVADWKGPSAGSRVSLRDTFKSETYDDLRTRLEALKTRRAALDEVEAKRTADTDYSVSVAQFEPMRESNGPIHQLLDAYPSFLAALDDALGQGSDHVLDPDFRALLHEQPQTLRSAISLGRIDEALHLLQALHFAAFDEQPANPLGEAMRRGSIAPVLHIMDELGGRRRSSSVHDAPQGNRIRDLLSDLVTSADGVLASQTLDARAAFDVSHLKQFARVSLARSKVDGERRVDLSDLDHAAWPIRQLYLGSLRPIENLVSLIVGHRLDYAPRLAIFRDELDLDRLSAEARARLLDLPNSVRSGLGPEMVKIPSGRFLMGACPQDLDAEDDEKPQHEVTIDHAFALARFPVTNGDWLFHAYVEDLQDHRAMRLDYSSARAYITFSSAVKYCEWLSIIFGNTYRIPSESEWEYSCRAGTSWVYWWGNSPDPDRAQYGVAKSRPTSLGEYPPNPWRLSDMLGNIREWCADHYEPYSGADRGQAPVRPTSDRMALQIGDFEPVILEDPGAMTNLSRGGSSASPSSSIRASKRFPHLGTKKALSRVGLRVARSL